MMSSSRKANQRGAVAFVPLVVLALLQVAATTHEVGPSTLLWAGPCLLLSAMLIAWGAESAQFFIAQGFALAILAWMQTLPEFAVEAVLAWRQEVPFLLANLTGALRMLTGLGWPMIYFAAAMVYRKRNGKAMKRIELDGHHSVEVVGLLLPLLYMGFVVWKRSLTVVDAVILIVIYAAYLILLTKLPPEEAEGIEELEAIPRAIVTSPKPRRVALISLCFLLGGGMIYFTAEPFLDSLKAVALLVGIPSFVFIQWVAPFVSEFPEMVSTYYFARTVTKAPMALMNMVSSNINQWTLLAAMLPIVYSFSRGSATAIPFDDRQTLELLMTLGQALVGMLFLVNLELTWWEAGSLFALWAVQFVLSAFLPDNPSSSSAHSVHWYITVLYYVWAAWELIRLLTGKRKPLAFVKFVEVWREHM